MREVVTDTGGHDEQAQDTLQVQENPSYQISRASNARAKVTSSGRNMNINTNLAYDFNSATQSNDMTDDYEYVAVTEDNTQQNHEHNTPLEADNIASNARAEDQTTEYAEVTSNENRDMSINTNLAYDFNSATQSYDMTDDYEYVAVTDDSTYQPMKTHVETDSMYAVVIEETTQQNPAYLANTTQPETANMNKTSDEENGSTQPPTPEQIIALTVRTASTICSFWQGRVEVCTRLTTIVVS